MRKVILSVLLSTIALCTSAQIWVGGNIGFNVRTTQPGNKSTTSFSIQPEVGLSLDENWDAAMRLSFTSVSDNKTTFSFSPYARYTFTALKNFSFLVDGGFEVGSSKPSNKSANFLFWIGIRPGIKFAVTENVTVVTHIASFGYRSVANEYNQVGLNVDNTLLSFGMYWGF